MLVGAVDNNFLTHPPSRANIPACATPAGAAAAQTVCSTLGSPHHATALACSMKSRRISLPQEQLRDHHSTHARVAQFSVSTEYLSLIHI